MPAESANTVTLVPSRLSPSVAHAASLSFIASRRRPNRPRRIATTSSDNEREHDRGEDHLRAGLVERVAEELERVDADRALLEEVDVERARTPRSFGRVNTQRSRIDRERGGAEREVDARRAAAQGARSSAPTAAVMSTAHTSASGSPLAPRWAIDDRADAGEAQLAQRDLAGEADERDERQGDDPDREDLAVGDEVGLAERRGEHDADATTAAAKPSAPGDRRHREELAAAGHRPRRRGFGRTSSTMNRMIAGIARRSPGGTGSGAGSRRGSPRCSRRRSRRGTSAAGCAAGRRSRRRTR